MKSLLPTCYEEEKKKLALFYTSTIVQQSVKCNTKALKATSNVIYVILQ